MYRSPHNQLQIEKNIGFLDEKRKPFLKKIIIRAKVGVINKFIRVKVDNIIIILR